MAPNKMVFISDVHIGLRRHRSEWFGKEHVKPLCDFLGWVSTRGDEVKDLVILGDFFDNWVCPAGAVPPTIADIIGAAPNRPIWAMLHRCLRNLTHVYYVKGNHDMDTTQADLDLLADPRSGKAPQLINSYLDGVLVGEHGHAEAMFNAPDRVHDPVNGVPLGYFITRVLAKTTQAADCPAAIGSYLVSVHKSKHEGKTLAEAVLDAVMSFVGLEDEDLVELGAGLPDPTLGEVKARYRDLYELWKAAKGDGGAVDALRAEAFGLSPYVYRLQERFKIVVLGHTHEALVKAYPQQHKHDPGVEVREIYANTGKGCTERPTFVEVTNHPGGKWEVELKRVGYTGGSKPRLQITTLDEEALG
ncbi:MAG TPA: metallophosphoesterase [Myxococcota bacterium]|nr:metallophosphoesterase [Myxococcota bacterium]HRY96077.1 metallophosphoesterase [Myxococcota bacterium]HSA22621.1 metallophosphoesterase [Myxococcota bacterium]